MRNSLLLLVVALTACGGATLHSKVGPASDDASTSRSVSAEGYLDKVTLGYQGWFAAPGDGSPMNEWVHWSRGAAPAPGNITVEIYPDTREYDPADLFDTALGPLQNGSPARLYSAHSQRVVDTHFRWMQENGLDGVGLQRFAVTLHDPRHKVFRDDVAQYVRNAAEHTGRVFYVEYDFSGDDEATWVEDLERDWTDTIVGTLHLPDSPQYLRDGGRPVVALWGFGFPDRPGTPARSVEVIEWFKAHGCYVVGGVPYGWRTGGGTKPGFDAVWAHLDVIQPWAVGALNTEADAASHRTAFIEPDKQWATQHGVGYQRVMFPGFAWSNWNGGTRNMIPRRGGRFFWAQAVAATQSHVSTFVAMFDEYDEGTAIAKAAEDPSMTPASQYFYSLDADGEHLSSDFYLRLAGAATRMMKGQDPLVTSVPIPGWVGPPPSTPPPSTPPPSTPPPTTPPPTTPPPATGNVPAQTAVAETTSGALSPAQAGVLVERLYRAILGREVDPSGRGTYTPLLQAGKVRLTINALTISPEFDARRASLVAGDWTEDLYQKLLDRGADDSGRQATLSAIAATHAPERIADIVLSPEYANNNP